MKTRAGFAKLIFIILMFVATTSWALAYTQPPNHFSFHGENLNVSYSTTSLMGKPFLSYDDGIKSRNFMGDEIRTVGTEIGTLVSVTLWKTKSGFTTFTILIPKSEVGSGEQLFLHTQGIITKHKYPVKPGQLNTYRYILLKGSAAVWYS